MSEPNAICYDELNSQLVSFLTDSDGLNYCRFLLPETEGIISAIGKYDPCCCPGMLKDSTRSYVTLDAGLSVVKSTDLAKFYYGVSPEIDGPVLAEAISKRQLGSTQRLEGFIADHHSAFMLHADQGEYLLPCAKLFVLSIAHNFGIRICVKDTGLRQKLLSYSNCALTSPGRTDDEILLCGCPTDELFDLLKDRRFQKTEKNDCWRCCSDPASDAVSLDAIYQSADNIILLNGRTFYSGALLKILALTEHRKNYGNAGVVPICLYFERSSYGTVFTFDNNFTAHPLLADCRDILVKMFREDDECKRQLLAATTGDHIADPGQRSARLNAINDYLARSHNVNQLGVTGNVLTSDKILLVGLREQDSIDSGFLYPSVNGNAEVIDENVSFYKQSAYEDYPAITIDGNRIDFNGELCREAYAELGILLSSNWHCYGLTISGTVPPPDAGDGYTIKKRRMHFNVLCEQACDRSFMDILDKQKQATEAYESKTINGLKVAYYKNWWAFLLAQVGNAISVLINNESYIMSIAALAVFLTSFSSNMENIGSSGVVDYLSAFFTMLTLIAFAIMVGKGVKEYTQRKEHIRKINIIGTKDLFSQLKRYFRKHACHPVTFTAIMCHITKTVLDAKKD